MIATAPLAWSGDYYGLVAAGERPTDQLAVCVAHRGAHVYSPHLDGCQVLPPRPRSARWRRVEPTASTPPPVQVIVTLDADKFGAAIARGVVEGIRTARQEQAR